MTGYYELLGVAPDAAPEEIKRAYYRKVRNHPPEKDPDGFKRLREAYETLSDPRARSQYDAVAEHGDEISLLMQEAEEFVEKDDYASAIKKLKRILVLSPKADTARMRLGLSYLNLDQYDESIKHFDKLCTEPEPLPLWLFYGAQARRLRADQEEVEEPEALRLRQEAVMLLERAVELDPMNAEHALGLARVQLALNQPEEALRWVERAVDADGRVDFQDFDALFFGCLVHLKTKNTAGLNAMVERILKLTADDDDHRGYAGWHFGRVAWQLCSACNFASALRMAQAARQLCPEEEKHKGLLEFVETLVSLDEEHDAIPEADNFARYLVGLEIRTRLAEKEEIDKLKAEWDRVSESLERHDPEDMLRWARQLKNSPVFYANNVQLVDAMLARGEAHGPGQLLNDGSWQPPAAVTRHSDAPLGNEWFFVPPPAEIGRVSSAESTLQRGAEPRAPGRRMAYAALAGLSAPALVAGCLLLVSEPLSDLASASAFLTWVCAPFLLLAALAWWLQRFQGLCSYVGTKGVARYQFENDPQKARCNVLFLFERAAELRTARTMHYRNGVYTHTSYSYNWTDAQGRRVYSVFSSYRSSAPDAQAQFLQAAEVAWSISLLERAQEELDRDGCITFRLGGKGYLKIGEGFMELCQGGSKVERLERREVAAFSLEKGTFRVQRVGAKAGFLGIGSSGYFSFDYSSMANARVFLLALNKLMDMRV